MSGARTMDKCIVDTDILWEYLRGRNAEVRDRAREYLAEHGRFTISVVTVFEGEGGTRRAKASQGERALQFLERANQNAEVLGFDVACAAKAGEIAGAILRAGTPLAVAKVIIAGTAVVHGLVIVTGNTKHYDRVVPFGVTLDNWRAQPPGTL
jgi:tRNA(fMet)-specific endonuclease VapC